MEILITLALVVALNLPATRFGVDSRDRARAEEERQAALGLAWDGAPAAPRPTEPRPAPARASR